MCAVNAFIFNFVILGIVKSLNVPHALINSFGEKVIY
jgi:hypothetical protein